MAKKTKVQSTEADTDSSITYTSNTAGALSPVLTKTVQSPYQYVIVNGFAMRVDARDVNDAKIQEGRAVLAWSAPDDPGVNTIDDRDLRTYADLSFTEQRQDDFAAQVQYEVEDGELVIPTDFEVGIWLDSATAIDTANSFFEFEARREQSQ